MDPHHWMKDLTLVFALLFLTLIAHTDAAVPRRELSDEQIVTQGQLVAAGTYVEIYQHGLRWSHPFLGLCNTHTNRCKK